jgi:apolipoprotein D and lipocalin family protein
MRIISLLFILPFFSGCGIFSKTTYAPLPVVPNVDLERYAGLWYEIASLPVRQQRGCVCTTAEYVLRDDGTIGVINRCLDGSPAGKEKKVSGKAFPVEGTGNAKLKVQFFWPFRGDYWIIDLADDYSYAVVGVPSRKYVWILSRTPNMDEEMLTMLLTRISRLGFDTAQMQRTEHGCG